MMIQILGFLAQAAGTMTPEEEKTLKRKIESSLYLHMIEKAGLEAEMKAATTARTKAVGEVNKLERNLSALQAKKTAAEGAREAANRKIQDLDGKIKECDRWIATLTCQRNGLN